MTDEIKIPEEIKEEAENLQELVEEEIGDAAEETIEVVEAEIVEDTPLDAAQEELEKVQERAQEIAAEVEDSEVMKIADKVEFTPEELAIIDKYAAAVDLKDTNSVLQFGADAQEKLSEFSESALTNVRTSDLGTIGDSLSGLVTELKGFSATEERHGLAKLFHKALDPIEEMKNRYDKANSNVEKVVNILDGHQVTLTKDIAVLDELFNANTENFKNLSMYIAAGKKALKEAREVTLPEMKAKAEVTGDQGDLQAATDYAQMIDRFEKKIYDLDLTRTVSLQMAPQIRMIQNNDTLMVEKIQTALVNTIPLWKSQMVLALGLANSEEALKAQRAVSETTNELLRKNADLLHDTTVGVAQESERGIIDIETLTETNNKLISTIDEVMQIQKEGHEKRVEAEIELRRLEGELRDKVLETIS
ncbi:MAG: toxic anion resistance protein [Firmicutes bacterium]|nr:toxic anion resistance protein [Bacillota bacterium]MBR3183203.1 toxic anion resistance protein [Bacillota bacterium]MBR3260100.1 toxic anion resistance protein [Bacillota bacterium]MBR3375250.1 toxic anion resistance protein [Bacillota bacterium]MBR4023984.1 toxic anion resistance protein [Bacillota bacterium]